LFSSAKQLFHELQTFRRQEETGSAGSARTMQRMWAYLCPFLYVYCFLLFYATHAAAMRCGGGTDACRRDAPALDFGRMKRWLQGGSRNCIQYVNMRQAMCDFE